MATVSATTLQPPPPSSSSLSPFPMTLSSSSSVERIVRQAASQIGLLPSNEESTIVARVCEAMKDEYVLHDWQLAEIDSLQWKDLGAPIGLSAAIRNLVIRQPKRHEKQRWIDDGEEINEDETTTNESNKLSFLTSNSSKAIETTSMGGASQVQLASISELEEGEDERQNVATVPTKTVIRKRQRTTRPPNSLWEVLTAFPACQAERPFPFTDTFHRALLHSKSGEELKAHSLFVMELMIVVSALMVGASVELWGAFPVDNVIPSSPVVSDGNEDNIDKLDGVPEIMGLIFNCLACASISIQVFSTMAWIFFLTVAAAVSPKNYNQFLQQSRYVMRKYWLFIECGLVSFFAATAVLSAAMVWSMTAYSTTNEIWRYVLGIGFPGLVTLPLIFFLHNFTSYVGRMAFHGLLLPYPSTNDPPSASTSPSPSRSGSLARKMETELCRTFYENVERDKNAVYDRCVMKSSSRASALTGACHTVKQKQRQQSSHRRQKHYFAPEYLIPTYDAGADENQHSNV